MIMNNRNYNVWKCLIYGREQKLQYYNFVNALYLWASETQKAVESGTQILNKAFRIFFYFLFFCRTFLQCLENVSISIFMCAIFQCITILILTSSSRNVSMNSLKAISYAMLTTGYRTIYQIACYLTKKIVDTTRSVSWKISDMILYSVITLLFFISGLYLPLC